MEPRRRKHDHLFVHVILLTSLPLAARAATFQGLGDLPGGSVQGYSIGVSPDGQFVAGHSVSGSGDEAFLWSAGGGMVGLGDLPGGAFDSFSTMASNGGAVAVGYGAIAGGYRPFRWTTAFGMVVLGDLPGGGSNGFATGMSADGAVICGQSTSSAGTEAFRWTPTGGMAGLGDFPGGAFDSSSWAVASDGSAVVGDGTTAAGRQAFRWTAADGLLPLGFLAGGGTFSGAHGVSSGGAFVAGASDSSDAGPGAIEAYRWSATGGMEGLGDLPGGAFGSFANGISADGVVVVGGSETTAGTEAFLWTPECGMRNLRTHLLSLGVSAVSSWTLQNAHGVSADGKTIVGYGINPSGQTEPWIARLPVCGTGAGEIPDGSLVTGAPLSVSKELEGAIRLTWSQSCDPGDSDYAVYEGALGSFSSHLADLCSTLGATTTTLVPGEENRYFLVVPHNGAFEGSYGRTSGALERSPSPAACVEQAIERCP